MSPSLTASTLGHFRLEGLLGAGSMGIVYLARDLRLDRYVAIKILAAELDSPMRKHFREEALTLSRLNHPNIAAVFEYDSDGPHDFLAMEYVPGEGLDTLLEGAPFETVRAAALGRQLAEGLAAAHGAGIIHCDIKPSNLRVTPEGRLKILDFGIATRDPRSSQSAATHTDCGSLLRLAGTLHYMSPERLRGEPADERTDIFSVGVVLYEMVAGRRPFVETHPIRLIELILGAVPPPPSTFNSNLHHRLDTLVMRALEKDPRRRYSNATELATALEEVPLRDRTPYVRTASAFLERHFTKLVSRVGDLLAASNPSADVGLVPRFSFSRSDETPR